MAQKTLQDITADLAALQQRIKTEGITDSSGKVLVAPDTYDPSTNTIKLPEQPQWNADLSTGQGRTSYYQQLIELQQQEAEQLRKDRELAIKQQAENKSSLQKLQEKFGLIGQKREEGLAELGFEPSQVFAQQKAQLAEVDALYQDYNATVAMRDKQIAQSHDKLAPMDFINNQIAQINRNANVVLGQKSSNINSKLAIMEAQNNNWEQAQKFVNQAITDYTAGLTADYDMALKFYDENQDLIDSLGKDYTSALKERNALILDQIIAAEREVQQKIDNDFRQQGIDINLMQEERLGREATTGTTSTNVNDILQDAIDNGATPSEAARAAATVYEGMGIQATQKDLNNWTEQAKNLTKTPVPEAPKKPEPIIISQKGFEAGKKAQSAFKNIPAEAQKALYIPGLGEAAATAVDWFRGLFSK